MSTHEKKLQKARKKAGGSWVSLAKAIGVKDATIHQWRKGGIPSARIPQIEEVLGESIGTNRKTPGRKPRASQGVSVKEVRVAPTGKFAVIIGTGEDLLMSVLKEFRM